MINSSGKRELGSFYMRESGHIREVYEIFLIIECPIHIFNICIILATPMFLISNKALIHKNLKILIISYLIAGICMSISRLSWLILDLLWTPINIMEYFMYLRFIFQTSISAHLFGFTAERVTATVKSDKYERNSCNFFIILCCILTYPYSLLLLYSKYNFVYGRELNVAMMVIFSSGGFLLMLVVYISNKKKVTGKRWKAQISEAYQIRENIRVSRLFLVIYASGMILLFIGCIFLLQFSATLTDPTQRWTTIISGFGYDITVACASAFGSTFLLHFIITDNTKKKIIAFFRCPYVRNKIEVVPKEKRLSFKNIHGVSVEVGHTAEEEARVYFSQLSNAWG